MCDEASRRRHTSFDCDWSSDVCSSDLAPICAHDVRAKQYLLVEHGVDLRGQARPERLAAVGGVRRLLAGSVSGGRIRASQCADHASSLRSEERRVGYVSRAVCVMRQAEDGIRVLTVTGVQTCALPIWRRFARTMFGLSNISWLSMALIYAVKLVLSAWLPLAEFGGYSLAASLAGGLGLLSAPIMQAV